MRREIIEDLERYFYQKENRNKKEEYLLFQLQNSLSMFDITSVSREDLETLGLDSSDVDDGTMEAIAGEMVDDYCFELFWSSLENIAVEKYKIPAKKVKNKGDGR